MKTPTILSYPLLLATVIAAVTSMQRSSADTLTFPGASGPFVGPATEGAFTYSVFSGFIFQNADLGSGNPAPHLEGGSILPIPFGGGTLKIVRNDAGLFTFDAADVAGVGAIDTDAVLVEGFLGGNSQGTDSLAITPGTHNWATKNSANLANVLVDELHISLDAGFFGIFIQDFDDFPFPEFFSEDLDNVVLTPVGAPDAGSTMALMGLGMGALVSVRRKVRA